MNKCTKSCTRYRDQYGDITCWSHGNISTSYRAGDAIDLTDIGTHTRYELSEEHIRGLFNQWPSLTMLEMARELGCTIDVLRRRHKLMGLSVSAKNKAQART